MMRRRIASVAVLSCLGILLVCGRAIAEKECPVCHAHYRDTYTACPKDGASLRKIKSHKEVGTTRHKPPHVLDKDIVKQDSKPTQEELNKNLIDAIYQHSPDKVKKLLAAGANPNPKPTRKKGDFSPLGCAIALHDSPIAYLLLDRGADPNSYTPGRDNDSLHPEVSCLMSAIGVGWGGGDVDLELVRRLIDRGARIDETDLYGMTPLMYAAQGEEGPGKADPKVLQLLISKGADVNRRDKRGRTALKYAEKYPECVAILRRAGAKE